MYFGLLYDKESCKVCNPVSWFDVHKRLLRIGGNYEDARREFFKKYGVKVVVYDEDSDGFVLEDATYVRPYYNHNKPVRGYFRRFGGKEDEFALEKFLGDSNLSYDEFYLHNFVVDLLRKLLVKSYDGEFSVKSNKKLTELYPVETILYGQPNFLSMMKLVGFYVRERGNEKFKYHIPDLLFCVDGFMWAVEVQKSFISPYNAISRMLMYSSLGVPVIWFFSDELPKRKKGRIQRILYKLYKSCFGGVFLFNEKLCRKMVNSTLKGSLPKFKSPFYFRPLFSKRRTRFRYYNKDRKEIRDINRVDELCYCAVNLRKFVYEHDIKLSDFEKSLIQSYSNEPIILLGGVCV